MTSRCVWVCGLSLLGLAACEDPSRAIAPPPDEDPALREMQDLLPPPAPSAWPDEIQSLRDTIEGFTDVDACLASLRARTPTEVAEGVADLGYDAFFGDVCASMRAVRDGSVEGCDELGVSTARRGCRRRLAIFHGRPTACPEDPVTPGREAVCVAWASRDADLCRAAAAPERARCRAVLGGDAEACGAERGDDRVRCEAEVERYGSALGEDRRESPAAREPSELSLELDGQTLRPGDGARGDLARGARLTVAGCRTRVVLAESIGAAAVGQREPSFALELTIPPRVELPARIPLGVADARLEVTTPRRGSLSSTSGARGYVELTDYERQLGGALRGTIVGELAALDERVEVRGRFATFIRDLDPLDDACRAP
ncbi:MAG: hypothetical protein H6719_28340 [Sandaracinaceae bacterium]|nr:hypothetical protein [Sandaracinaceae bacterium]